jgi:DNA topoisomerase-1
LAYEWSEQIEYVDCHTQGITRLRRGRGFCYRRPDGTLVEDAATRERIAAIAIPPAWREVWIAPSGHAHLQATGRDQRRRKQYRYHPAWSRERRLANYDRLSAFAAALPRIRKFVDHGLRRRVPDQTCLLALVLRLLDSGMIRIGNDEYLKTNGSRGLTTLRKRDVRIAGDELKFHFIAKGGIEQRLSIQDRRAARVLRRCHELGGHHLLNYVGPDGVVQRVTSSEVNALLEQLAGEKFTAKDFRTWAGTVAAFEQLRGVPPTGSAAADKAIVNAAIRCAAQRLCNTVAVCRSHYVHPRVVEAFQSGELAALPPARERRGLSATEAALLQLLRGGKRKRARRAPSLAHVAERPRAAAEARVL